MEGMQDSLFVANKGFGYLNYHTKRVDENDYKSEYVSSIVFRSVDNGWYRSIEFGGPDAIDHLISALSFIKMQHKCGGYFDDWVPDAEGYPGKVKENTFNSLIRCGREYAAIKRGDKWYCDACGNSLKQFNYGDKPLFCSQCGSFFKEYREEPAEDEEVTDA